MTLKLTIGYGNGGLSEFTIDTSRLPLHLTSQNGSIGVTLEKVQDTTPSTLRQSSGQAGSGTTVASEAIKNPEAPAPKPIQGKKFKSLVSTLPTPDADSEGDNERRY